MVQRAMRDALQPDPLRALALGLNLFALEEYEVTHKTLYQRGMLVWRTLETVIGRARVDAALRELYRRFHGRSAGLEDFRKICEEISGRELGWFFDFFIVGTEIPELKLRRLPSSAPNEYLGEIVFENVPSEFQSRVEMSFHTAQGVVENSVAAGGSVTPFSMNLPAPALRVTLDPDLRILHWTEAARRNRRQWEIFRASAAREPEGTPALAPELLSLVGVLDQVLEADAEDLAANRQQFIFFRARLLYRLKRYAPAMLEFQRVLESGSIEPMEAEFLRAWARVYRARIESARGRSSAAREEAVAGLKLSVPALDTPVAWPEQPDDFKTARQELQGFLRASGSKP
jgi:hypothetical protein